MAELSYGCRKAVPDGVRVVWGARLIAPADLLHDRQSWGGTEGSELPEHSSHESGPRSALAAWLNGGALGRMLINLRNEYGTGGWDGRSEDVRRLYEDEEGIIVGSPQGSHGYVYVAAWLFADVPERADGNRRGVEVTETGRVLTDADFEQLADDAVRESAS